MAVVPSIFRIRLKLPPNFEKICQFYCVDHCSPPGWVENSSRMKISNSCKMNILLKADRSVGQNCFPESQPVENVGTFQRYRVTRKALWRSVLFRGGLVSEDRSPVFPNITSRRSVKALRQENSETECLTNLVRLRQCCAPPIFSGNFSLEFRRLIFHALFVYYAINTMNFSCLAMGSQSSGQSNFEPGWVTLRAL